MAHGERRLPSFLNFIDTQAVVRERRRSGPSHRSCNQALSGECPKHVRKLNRRWGFSRTTTSRPLRRRVVSIRPSMRRVHPSVHQCPSLVSSQTAPRVKRIFGDRFAHVQSEESRRVECTAMPKKFWNNLPSHRRGWPVLGVSSSSAQPWRPNREPKKTRVAPAANPPRAVAWWT